MKPVKIFLFFVSILLIIAVASWFNPIEKSNILGWEVRFFKFPIEKFIPESLDSVPESNNTTSIETNIIQNTVQVKDSLIKVKKIFKERNPFSKSLVFPSDSGSQWNQLSDQLLMSDSINKPLRIIYYGDSQIENDRITSAFRKKIQNKYGGQGRGLIPVTNIFNSANNFVMTVSDNWKKTSVVGTKKKNLEIGILAESFKIFSQLPEDSVTAWVKIKRLNQEDKDGYTVASIFYTAKELSTIDITINGQQYKRELTSTSSIKELRLNLGNTPQTINFLFSTNTEIVIYGLSLESPSGIMVDNIALRGRSFPGFTMMDSIHFVQMAKLVKPGLIILHYGVNIVPNIRKEYGYYKKQLQQEIECINLFLPNVPIMLISTSDMAHKVNGEMKTYSNIEAVIKAQKEAALENDCAFWNLYESMGGSGTIIKWVEQKPPLGNKDYVHFTMQGADKIGYLLNKEFQTIIETKNDNDLVAND